MFGNKATRGLWFVRLPLTHYAAYRMQLFMYLKACGRDELNTMNLWVGIDASTDPPPSHSSAARRALSSVSICCCTCFRNSAGCAISRKGSGVPPVP